MQPNAVKISVSLACAQCRLTACPHAGCRLAAEGRLEKEAHLDRPLLSMITSARSMFCVLAAKASFRFCHVQLHGRLCTTTCSVTSTSQGSTLNHSASNASEGRCSKSQECLKNHASRILISSQGIASFNVDNENYQLCGDEQVFEGKLGTDWR